MRSGALSDEQVMKVCAEFFPVPLKKLNILEHKKENTSGLQFRAPKYTQPPPVPVNYFAMSNSMARHMDPTNVNALISRLNEVYDRQIKEPELTASVQPSPEAGPSQLEEIPDESLEAGPSQLDEIVDITSQLEEMSDESPEEPPETNAPKKGKGKQRGFSKDDKEVASQIFKTPKSRRKTTEKEEEEPEWLSEAKEMLVASRGSSAGASRSAGRLARRGTYAGQVAGQVASALMLPFKLSPTQISPKNRSPELV